MNWNEEYEKLERGDRIVDIVVTPEKHRKVGEKEIELYTVPIGFGYLHKRNTKPENMKLGAKKRSQLWAVIVLGVHKMSTEAWNNAVGVEVGKIKEFWISLDDLPESLHDDHEQLELLLAEDDPELKEKLEKAKAEEEAGLEVGSLGKIKALAERHEQEAT